MPITLAQGGGHVIHMASTLGMVASRYAAPYNVAKGGLLLLTRTTALELSSAEHPGQCGLPRTHRHRRLHRRLGDHDRCDSHRRTVSVAERRGESRATGVARQIRERYEALGVEPATNTPAQFAAFIREDADRFAKMLKAAGVKAD